MQLLADLAADSALFLAASVAGPTSLGMDPVTNHALFVILEHAHTLVHSPRRWRRFFDRLVSELERAA